MTKPAVVRTAPPRIWLQVTDDAAHMDCDFPHAHSAEVTWSQTRALACEVEYVRADLIERLSQQAEPVALPPLPDAFDYGYRSDGPGIRKFALYNEDQMHAYARAQQMAQQERQP